MSENKEKNLYKPKTTIVQHFRLLRDKKCKYCCYDKHGCYGDTYSVV